MKYIGLTIVMISIIATVLYAGGSCSASAGDCNVSCSVTAPPGGDTVCEGEDNYAGCFAYDANGDTVKEIEKRCDDGGGGGGGGGGTSGGGSLPTYCITNPSLCSNPSL